jgi:hypothetical protein
MRKMRKHDRAHGGLRRDGVSFESRAELGLGLSLGEQMLTSFFTDAYAATRFASDAVRHMVIVTARATTMAKSPTTIVVRNATQLQSAATAATVQTECPSPITETVATRDGHSSVEEAFAYIVGRTCRSSLWSARIAEFVPAGVACRTSCEGSPYDGNRWRSTVRIGTMGQRIRAISWVTFVILARSMGSKNGQVAVGVW